MHASPLIRVIDGVETPAPGQWTIAANQPVVGSRRSLGRRVTGMGRTIDGVVRIDESHLGSAMELSIAVEDLPFPVASTLQYRANALIPTAEGMWLLNGDLTAGAITRPLRAIARYHGVFRHGGRAAAWLTFHRRVDLSSFGARRILSGRYLDLITDLNADSPIAQARALRRVIEGAC
jgi:hypothetical protein